MNIDAFMDGLKNVTPEIEYDPSLDPVDFPDIKALWYSGVKYGEKETKVFAYIGFPRNMTQGPVPAAVLVHGGCGHAFPEWIKIWNDRGYAAIAMDNTGYAPNTGSANREWSHFDASAPDNDSLCNSEDPIDRQWLYHAVSQTILAHNILRADDRIDKNKIGLTGISWGGVISSNAICYDQRFAFAIPIYGSGYLSESKSLMKRFFTGTAERKVFDAGDKLESATMPVMWMCWNSDNCFSINTNQRSAEKTPGGFLCAVNNMLHGHIEAWIRPESYRFADSVIKCGEPPITCKTPPSALMGSNVTFEINIPADVTEIKVTLYYLDAKLSYSEVDGPEVTKMDQNWNTAAASCSNGIITALIPSEAYSYYIEFEYKAGGEKYISTTDFITLK